MCADVATFWADNPQALDSGSVHGLVSGSVHGAWWFVFGGGGSGGGGGCG